MSWLHFYVQLFIFITALTVFSSVDSAAQNGWYNQPNGQIRPIASTTGLNCGTCASGYTRKISNSPFFCGTCEPIGTSCSQGRVLIGNQCVDCPCPGAGPTSFGTSCRVDQTGQIKCECSPEYTGADCSQCAPGAVRSNQYPYNCIQYNSTSSQQSMCPAGNICQPASVSQVVNVPQVQPAPSGCPVVNPNPSNGCSAVSCPTQPISPPQQPYWPPQIQPPQQPYWPPQIQPPQIRTTAAPCVVQQPGPGPILCNTLVPPINPPCQANNCGTGCQPGGNCPPVVQPPTVCPPNQPCPPVQCPACPPIQGPCPPNTPCAPPPPCPPTVCPPTNTVCPPNQPCPPVQCPACPPIQGPCPPSPPCAPPPPCPPTVCPPGNNCPPVCPQPPACPSQCPPPPVIPACPACPSLCPSCPEIPACPQCPGICPPPCPAPPPCNNCPNPCQPCPTQSCPNCELTCPACPECKVPDLIITPGLQPCICDPSGTVAQYGSSCHCKSNVEGYKCDSCKPGYFALTSNRSEGCLQCWGSGVSSYCSAAIFYRTYIKASSASDCSVELTNEGNTVVYAAGTSGYSWNGSEARLSKSVSTRLFWSLPSCFKGNRLTSYGATLQFTRMFSGSGTSLGSDSDVIIVGGNGASIIWSSFGTLTSGASDISLVVLDETGHWTSFKSGTSRLATRFDILEVLADIQLILIRGTFTTNTATTSISGIQMGTVTDMKTTYGLVMVIEQARCPTGYQGLSCESCSEGYFRDTGDLSASVFGACKRCPCGRTARGCHSSMGQVVCDCMPGYAGDKCQDKAVITITLDPFYIRDFVGTNVDFTCTYTTNSKMALKMRLSKEGENPTPQSATSLTQTYQLTQGFPRVKCEVVDLSGTAWAIVYSSIAIEVTRAVLPPPQPRLISLLVTEEFICVDEGDPVEMTVNVQHFGMNLVKPEWRKEGDPRVLRADYVFRIGIAQVSDTGTYIVAATDGSSTGVARVVLVVRDNAGNGGQRDDPSVFVLPTNGTKNGTFLPANSITNEAGKKSPKDTQKSKQGNLYNKMIKDQPSIEGFPSVIVSPEDVQAQVGEAVTLRCNATGAEPLKFYWKSGANDYIPVHVRVSRGALIFKSIRKEDEGYYYCVAGNHIGLVSARAKITVVDKTKGLPSPPLSLTVSRPSQTSMPGGNVYLDCTASDVNAKIAWTKKGGDLPKSSQAQSNGSLVLYRVGEKDAGVYICTAQGAGQKAHVELNLSLLPIVPHTVPTIMLSPKSPVKVRSGDKIRVDCIASGYPFPTVSWFKATEGSERTLVTSDGNSTAYEILHATKADEGKYTCVATNAAGSKSESLSLIVDDAIICKSNEFRCKSGDQCVSKEDRCDEERDCKDGSDEHHCRKRTRRSYLDVAPLKI